MSPTQMLVWAMAVAAFGLLLRRRGLAPARRALRDTGASLLRLLPMIAVALPLATLFAELVPPDVAQGALGRESGLAGILIATAAGSLLPGGPFVTFPLVLAFLAAGAGPAQMVALISAWSVLGLHRILVWEIAILGRRFALLRVASGAALPVLAGLLAEALLLAFPALGR
ncbi:MAG: hypothetical protein NZM27_11420 [Acetobacteraceae bacterium]|nr:hypothetical protein [Acetobacteraceae bacterium]MCX7684402.1 hypothetical protein [Acetobacteraceae bacterium]MDW8396954.1 hypothetical protein [Acetobacteraceae bacterium]